MIVNLAPKFDKNFKMYFTFRSDDCTVLRLLFKSRSIGLTVPTEIQILCVTFDTASRNPGSYGSYGSYELFS